MSKNTIFLCLISIAVVGLITYYPASRVGFVNNDWIYLDRVARWNLPQYLFHYLVPGAESGWYRPLFGLHFLAVYSAFGPNPAAFHWAWVILHVLNGLLLFALVKRFARLSLALITSLLYVGLPVYSKAVYWPSTPDTLAMLFYLASIWFWVDYLATGKSRAAGLAFAGFVLALSAKETSLTLPLVLFLVDRLLVRKPAAMVNLARRYFGFALVWLPYLAMEYALQKSGAYVSLAGYGFGIHMFWNWVNSLSALAFPYRLDSPFNDVWLAIVVVAFVGIMLIKQSAPLAFLGSVVLLCLAPVMGFPTQWYEMRYLYGAAMIAALLYAAVVLWIGNLMRNPRGYTFVASGLIAILLISNGAGTAKAVAEWGEIARQRAVPFRDIVRMHPTFPDSTKLYFIDSPSTSVYDLSVMFLLRYGPSVIVDGTDDNQSNRIARLKDAPLTYVYFFDETGKPIEVKVSHASTSASPALPARFSAPIQLEAYEVTNNVLARGEPVVLFLYWRATEKIEEDYVVFVHLLDSQGKMIYGYDSQPRGGKSPTSTWEPGALFTDPVVLPIPRDTPFGSGYRLEVGMYAPSNGERLTIFDSNGKLTGDKVSFEPFQVTE